MAFLLFLFNKIWSNLPSKTVQVPSFVSKSAVFKLHIIQSESQFKYRLLTISSINFSLSCMCVCICVFIFNLYIKVQLQCQHVQKYCVFLQIFSFSLFFFLLNIFSILYIYQEKKKLAHCNSVCDICVKMYFCIHCERLPSISTYINKSKLNVWNLWQKITQNESFTMAVFKFVFFFLFNKRI